MRYKNNKIIKQFNIGSNEKEMKNKNMKFSLENLLNSDDRLYISCYAHRVDKLEFNKTIAYLEKTDNTEHIKDFMGLFRKIL